MVFLLSQEIGVPAGHGQFRVEKWVPQDSLMAWSDNGAGSNGAGRWSVSPYYRLLKVDGTELMNTDDWNHLAGYLRAVLGDQVVPYDFQL